MPKIQQTDERVSDGVNLLISILVRFPEIGTINYDAAGHTLKLTFLLSKTPAGSELGKLKTMLVNSIAAYHVLEGVRNATINVQTSACGSTAMLTILRDVPTFSKGEIVLIISLLRDKLKDQLVTDDNDSLLEEDLMVQEEVIDSMLANIKTHHGNGLIGIREDGRVLVFNK